MRVFCFFVFSCGCSQPIRNQLWQRYDAMLSEIWPSKLCNLYGTVCMVVISVFDNIIGRRQMRIWVNKLTNATEIIQSRRILILLMQRPDGKLFLIIICDHSYHNLSLSKNKLSLQPENSSSSVFPNWWYVLWQKVNSLCQYFEAALLLE